MRIRRKSWAFPGFFHLFFFASLSVSRPPVSPRTASHLASPDLGPLQPRPFLSFFVDSMKDETSGTCAPFAIGSGEATVRAPRTGDDRRLSLPSGERCLRDKDGRCASRPRRASTGRNSAHPPPVPPRLSMHPMTGSRSGLTGGSLANFGGISTSALEISTATGLRSEP